MIPLVDLTIDKKLRDKITKEITQVVDSKKYILGAKLESFEKKFAKFIGVKYAIGVGNGTDALRLSLRALGIGRGDKVLTVSLTSPFTAIAVVEEGAIPVFCDIDEATWTIDVADARKRIDRKTRAIIPVHLFGNPCDMSPILKFAKENHLKVIEDACQAHGAKYQGKMVGSLGAAAAFSFYPTKNLGAFGDAGIVTTNNSKLAKMIKCLRHGGQTKRFWHSYIGINSRLDEIQAAILGQKLKVLEVENKKRVKIAKKYKSNLSRLPIVFQKKYGRAEPVFHLLAARIRLRNKLIKFLKKNNIAADIYYPHAITEQPAFRKFVSDELPVTEMLTKELTALPIYPRLSYQNLDFIIRKIKDFFNVK
ncbi:MAG: pyridoxal phosphate-dependent protein [Candidatus Curtissbacteria bacterium GW2011_GWA1_40_47]|uniref:Erythromycin biosynthesis sensory transduction protein eryC1 n=1 Tax=Candidatus Curtissbacteria bacterium RIFOXYA1_FULL_41_14 TaxID=1797737 RepID=A0A1F5HAS3_9BACT|nr:MAG: pyridoxal phosphate-dependent protein [Candidatus Curtissbacteria bacterium GW2011_GWB1_40_28]KKR62370.1 MAG: pyridoxal phosphate-dependent protein [Microgenomates group bacterium GW2011_GWC1_40_35]KKR66429.1 MAG: pyridoxal phosphate-dependent protein [Candidatus Curtissbacteria bacterium GW2011_GWA1_40_47]KKR77911.1 MAG: pyridoxal phosphate-dependent protein [Candidatus Curtissbacteria bacterium GW2011_GWD1_40_8]KKS02538.1 MAG: pyridoxal phosphate-dependent protein [Candidatus Curtissb